MFFMVATENLDQGWASYGLPVSLDLSKSLIHWLCWRACWELNFNDIWRIKIIYPNWEHFQFLRILVLAKTLITEIWQIIEILLGAIWNESKAHVGVLILQQLQILNPRNDFVLGAAFTWAGTQVRHNCGTHLWWPVG